MLTNEEIDEVVDWQLSKQKPWIKRKMFEVLGDFPDVYTSDKAVWPVPDPAHDLDLMEQQQIDLSEELTELLESDTMV